MELETEDGKRNGTFKWYICDRALLINLFCKRSTLLTKAFEEVCGEFGRVLHMIFYCDEFTPGNVLDPDTSRKSWGFYVSFREFGPARLCHKELWFAIGVLRTGIENQVVGGLSNIIRLLMRMCFTEPVNIRDPGIVVALGGRMEYIRIEFGQILADTDALRAALSLKGANGIKPCMCCGNCVKKGNRSSRPGTGIFDILHHDLKDFRRCKCTDIWASVDRLEAELGTLNITSFRKLEKTIGFKYNPHALLADKSLRKHFKPSEALRYDPLHVILAGGIACLEIWGFLSECCSRMGIGYSTIRQFVCADWKYTSSRAQGSRKSVKSFFSNKREQACKKKGALKCQASEILAVYPLLRHFARTIVVPAGQFVLQCRALFALCDFIDAYLVAKREHRNLSASELARRAEAFFKACKEAWGDDIVVPKHHYMLHLAIQYMADGFLMDCFVTERMHHVMKQHSQLLYNTGWFERTLIMRSTRERLRTLQNMTNGTILKPSDRWHELETLYNGEIYRSTRLVHRCATYCRDDIIISYTDVGMQCFLILMCFVGGATGFKARALELVCKVDDAASKWKLNEEPVKFLLLESLGFVQGAQNWAFTADGHVTVLHHSCY